MVNLRIFCVNGDRFLTCGSSVGKRSKTGSDVERRTRKTSSIIFTLGKIELCCEKVLRVAS